VLKASCLLLQNLQDALTSEGIFHFELHFGLRRTLKCSLCNYLWCSEPRKTPHRSLGLCVPHSAMSFCGALCCCSAADKSIPWPSADSHGPDTQLLCERSFPLSGKYQLFSARKKSEWWQAMHKQCCRAGWDFARGIYLSTITEVFAVVLSGWIKHQAAASPMRTPCNPTAHWLMCTTGMLRSSADVSNSTLTEKHSVFSCICVLCIWDWRGYISRISGILDTPWNFHCAL